MSNVMNQVQQLTGDRGDHTVTTILQEVVRTFLVRVERFAGLTDDRGVCMSTEQNLPDEHYLTLTTKQNSWNGCRLLLYTRYTAAPLLY